MKKLFAITVLMSLAMSGFAQQIHYDFAETIESGQTLYFLKIDYAPQEVWVTYPCFRDYYANGDHITTYYYGFEKPVGDMVIPATVTHNDTVYTITRIDFSAFYECSGITSVVFPSTLTFIGQRAFLGCHGITGEVVIPDSVTIIGTNAFFYCENITSVIFGSNLSEIRSYSFAQCYSLKHISNLPETLTVLADGAFDSCGSLCDSIVIPPLVTTIGERAFAGCQIPSVVISEGVTTIKRGAFSYCPIGALHVPSTLVSISPENNAYGDGAFHNCTKLQSITVDEANPVYDSRNDCNALIETATNTLLKGCKNTIIPNTVSIIWEGAFAGCLDLDFITIPNSVSYLGIGAFARCDSLSTITLPSSVSYISDCALACSGLTSITCKSSTPPTAFFEYGYYYYSNSFGNEVSWVNREIPIYIPYGTTETYQNASGWNYFSNFIEEEPIIYTDFEPDSCITDQYTRLWVDFDDDGYGDICLKMDYTSTGYWPEIISSDDWEITWLDDDDTDILPNIDHWGHSYLWLDDEDQNRFAARKQIGNNYVFTWFEAYNYVTFNPFVCHVCFDKFAYCTIPNYTFEWGQTTITEGLGEETIKTDFTVYPNPTNGVLFIETNGHASLSNKTYRITNLMGQTLMQGHITDEAQQINIENLPAGMYFITVAGKTQKFIVK